MRVAFFGGRERGLSARSFALASLARHRDSQNVRVARWSTGKATRERGENGGRRGAQGTPKAATFLCRFCSGSLLAQLPFHLAGELKSASCAPASHPVVILSYLCAILGEEEGCTSGPWRRGPVQSSSFFFLLTLAPKERRGRGRASDGEPATEVNKRCLGPHFFSPLFSFLLAVFFFVTWRDALRPRADQNATREHQKREESARGTRPKGRAPRCFLLFFLSLQRQKKKEEYPFPRSGKEKVFSLFLPLPGEGYSRVLRRAIVTEVVHGRRNGKSAAA